MAQEQSCARGHHSASFYQPGPEARNEGASPALPKEEESVLTWITFVIADDLLTVRFAILDCALFARLTDSLRVGAGVTAALNTPG